MNGDVEMHHAKNCGNKKFLAILSRILAQSCVTPLQSQNLSSLEVFKMYYVIGVSTPSLRSLLTLITT